MSPLSLPMRISHRLRQRERQFIADIAETDQLIERARDALQKYPEKAHEIREIEREARRIKRRNKVDLMRVRALRAIAEWFE